MIINSIATTGQTPNWIWAEQTTGNGHSYAQYIASDSNNNIYICGYLMDSIQFGNQSLFSDNQRAYVAKYNSNGVFQWVTSFPSNISSFASRISVDNEDNIIVTGSFHGTLTAGSYTLNTNSQDLYLIKINPYGTVLWAEQSICSSLTQAIAIKIDNDNNIFIAGNNNVQATFGNLIADKVGMFILKYDSNGTPLHLINEYACGCCSIDVIDSNIYFSGTISDTTIIGIDTLYPTGYYEYNIYGDTVYIMNNDLIFICYNDIGNVLWIKQAESKAHDLWTNTTFDDYSNYYISGEIGDTTNFWGTMLYPSGGLATPFLLKTDPLGNINWLIYGVPVSPGGHITFHDIKIKGEYIYLVGSPYGSSSFANMNITNNAYVYNTFILKLDLDGNGVWPIIDTTNLAHNNPKGITIDLMENIAICGYFEDTVHFGNNYLYSIGGQTMFVAKILSAPIFIEDGNMLVGEKDIKVFPNPTRGDFTLSIPPDQIQLNLFSSNGKLLQKTNVNHQTSIKIKINYSGLYYLQIIFNNKVLYKKIIVTK